MKAAFVTGGSGFVGRELIAALVERGVPVRALARSASAQEAVAARGATPVAGDLSDADALRAGMEDCDVVFHAAACTEEWAPDEVFERVNVEGTRRVLEAAGGRRVVHFSTEAVLVDGRPLVDVDETVPVPEGVLRGYPGSKARAERLVREAGGVVVRPRFIWGRGDTSLLPKLVGKVRSGGFAWIGGGRFMTSTCHVRNAVEGALLAAEHGRPGGVYFLTDGPPVEMRAFMTSMLGTQGVDPGTRVLPFRLALALAVVCEAVWRLLRLRSAPPVTRTAVLLAGQTMTVRDDLARRELGYEGLVSREQGLEEMSSAMR